MDNDSNHEKEEYELVKNCILNEKYLKKLQNLFDEESKKHKKILQGLDDEIFEQETKVNETRMENEMKNRLVKQWEDTRYFHAKIKNENKERELIHAKEMAKSLLERELRLRTEIEGKGKG